MNDKERALAHLNPLLDYCVSLARQPVSKTCYEGKDIRFTPAFERVEGELNKGQSVLNSSAVDWGTVRQGCERILSEQSKDLRVACWLVWALYQGDSFPGLLAGMGLLHTLCADHWLSVHPRKSRTRGAAIGWLLLRIEKIPFEDVPLKKQLALFEALERYVAGMDDLLGQYLNDDAPLMLPLRRRLSRIIERAARSEDERTTVKEQVRQAANHLFSSGSLIRTEKDARQAWLSLRTAAYTLTGWWLQQKTTDVRAIRLNREVMWLNIEGAPPSNADGVTELRGLPADSLKIYRDRLVKGDYAELIILLESSLQGCPFWLDGQRWVWECLQGLNAEMAMNELEIQLALFLQRTPAAVELRFHDGLPFADDETRDWINSHVMPHSMPEESEPCRPDSRGQPAWESTWQELLPVMRKEGLKPAVRMINQHLEEARGGRARFFWQFALARLFYEARKYEMARIQLELLDEQIKAGELQTWEPEAALDVWRLLYRCHQRLPHSTVSVPGRDDVYRKLCQHDVETVLDKN